MRLQIDNTKSNPVMPIKLQNSINPLQDGRSTARLLLAAALSIPGISAIPNLMAPTAARSESSENEFRFSFFNYREWQAGNDQRMHVNAPMVYVKSMVDSSTQVDGSFVLDSVSGASPLYHDTLSGASGKGIEDQRTAANINVTETFDSFSLRLGGSLSNEDDYDSNGASIEGRFWGPSRNTILNIGLSAARDKITSSNDPTLDEDKSTTGLGLGVTQILDENSIGQSNITFSASHGYQSDSYKSFDLRPESREGMAWLTRYIRYFASADGSLHADYRYFQDNWGVRAHTLETRWYQPLGSSPWTLIPRIRYYSQCKADFYSNDFPPTEDSQSYTADQRLSGFGSILFGLKLEREIQKDMGASLSFDYMQQRGLFKIDGPGSPGLDPFSAGILSLGFFVKF